MEIQGRWSREDDATSSYFTYGWNGQLYGLWPSTPQPGEYDFLPRDRVSVTVGAGVSTTSGAYKYSYKVTNSSLSIQAVNEFLVGSGVDTVWAVTAKVGWWFFRYGNLFCWTEFHEGETTRFINSGTSDDSMSFNSSDPPTIVQYYARGFNKEPLNTPAGPPIDYYGDIFTNSFTGRTIGPATPPHPSTASAFLIPSDHISTKAVFLAGLRTIRPRTSTSVLLIRPRHICKQTSAV